ncbi:MAG: class II glutamine amidotransferase [Proteobacteria bacterium]|nr:class II glutamine amidotransferase [Pseudomonadota bacterium]
MCRFVFYRGRALRLELLTTLPSHSIIHQSSHSRERAEPLNGDGFGIAWYAPEFSAQPAVFRSITPAWSNQNLREIARVVQSQTILAHVRAASPGLPVVERNCHPFVCESFSFMHNGYIPQFLNVKRDIQNALSQKAYRQLGGSTDSEHIFALFCDAFERTSVDKPRVERMAQALEQAIKQILKMMKSAGIQEAAQLNLCVSDGMDAVVTRFCSDDSVKANSLYWHEGSEYTCTDGVCHMRNPDVDNGAVIVASEPLSKDEGWELVPNNHLVLITKDVELRAIQIGL